MTGVLDLKDYLLLDANNLASTVHISPVKHDRIMDVLYLFDLKSYKLRFFVVPALNAE